MSIQAALLAVLLLGSGATSEPAKQQRPSLETNVDPNRLTPEQLAYLRALAEVERSRQRNEKSPSERCYDREIKRAGGSPSHLEQQAIDMKCRDIGAGLN